MFRTLPLTLLRQTAAYKYFQFFCPTVCLESVFRPKRTLFCGLSAQVLHKLTAVVGNVLPFEAFFGHLLFGGSSTISIASCFGSNALEYVGSHDLTNAFLRRFATARENLQLSRCKLQECGNGSRCGLGQQHVDSVASSPR